MLRPISNFLLHRSNTRLLGALLASVACTSQSPTEIVAGVSTQIQVPEYLKAVAIVVQESGRTQFCEVYEVANGQATLPATLGVLDEGAQGPVDVRVLGLRTLDSPVSTDCTFAPPEPGGDSDRQVMVIRRRRDSFLDENILILNLPLKEYCRDVSCAADQTCVVGLCADIVAPPPSLPPWDPGLMKAELCGFFKPEVPLRDRADLA